MCPHTPTPKCSFTLVALNINLLAEQMLNERYSAGYQAPVFGFSLRFPRPSPANKHLKNRVTLGDLSPDFCSVYLGRCRYMMANQVIRALFVYSLALFYGFMVCFFLLLSAIRKLEIPRRGKRREKRK